MKRPAHTSQNAVHWQINSRIFIRFGLSLFSLGNRYYSDESLLKRAVNALQTRLEMFGSLAVLMCSNHVSCFEITPNTSANISNNEEWHLVHCCCFLSLLWFYAKCVAVRLVLGSEETNTHPV